MRTLRGREAANIRLLEPTCSVGCPAEHGEGARADLAFHAAVFFDHLDERVVGCGETVVAYGGEVGDFGAAAVYVGFGAGGGHDCGDDGLWWW